MDLQTRRHISSDKQQGHAREDTQKHTHTPDRLIRPEPLEEAIEGITDLAEMILHASLSLIVNHLETQTHRGGLGVEGRGTQKREYGSMIRLLVKFCYMCIGSIASLPWPCAVRYQAMESD